MGKKSNPYVLKRDYLKSLQEIQLRKSLEESFDIKTENETQKENEIKKQKILNVMLFLMEHPECIQIDFEALQEEKNNILRGKSIVEEIINTERESNGKSNTLE